MHHNYWAYALEPASHNYWARVPRARALQQEKPLQWEAHAPKWRVAPSPQLEKAQVQQQRPNAAKKKKKCGYNLLFHFKFTREEAEVQKAISLIKRNLQLTNEVLEPLNEWIQSILHTPWWFSKLVYLYKHLEPSGSWMRVPGRVIFHYETFVLVT